jgi:hypothetical protein
MSKWLLLVSFLGAVVGVGAKEKAPRSLDKTQEYWRTSSALEYYQVITGIDSEIFGEKAGFVYRGLKKQSDDIRAKQDNLLAKAGKDPKNGFQNPLTAAQQKEFDKLGKEFEALRQPILMAERLATYPDIAALKAHKDDFNVILSPGTLSPTYPATGLAKGEIAALEKKLRRQKPMKNFKTLATEVLKEISGGVDNSTVHGG